MVSIDRLPLGDGVQPGPMTRAIQACYFAVVRGEKPAYRHWLTPGLRPLSRGPPQRWILRAGRARTGQPRADGSAPGGRPPQVVDLVAARRTPAHRRSTVTKPPGRQVDAAITRSIPEPRPMAARNASATAARSSGPTHGVDAAAAGEARRLRLSSSTSW